MALHKMIRLVTISAGGDAYLNFMGNEFGHPEWIDFPREGNGWSYAYARRQWSLADNGLLRYAQLGEFDRAMIALVKKYGILRDGYPYNLQMDTQNQTMAFSHGDLLFVFNWHPSASIPNYEVRVRVPGRYRPILSTDERRFGGTERTDMRGSISPTRAGDELPRIRIYNTSRTATVFLRSVKESTSRPHYPHRAVGKRPFPARPSYREIRDSEAAEAYQTTKTSKTTIHRCRAGFQTTISIQ